MPYSRACFAASSSTALLLIAALGGCDGAPEPGRAGDQGPDAEVDLSHEADALRRDAAAEASDDSGADVALEGDFTDADTSADGSAAPASTIFEARPAAPPTADGDYLSEETTRYRAPLALPDADVRAIAAREDVVLIGTSSGAAELDWNRDRFVALDLGVAGPVHDVAIDVHGAGWFATDAGVLRRDAEGVVAALGGPGAATAVSGGADAVHAVFDTHVWTHADTGWIPVEALRDVEVWTLDAAQSGPVVAAGPGGVWRSSDAGAWAPLSAEPTVAGAACPDGAVVAVEHDHLVMYGITGEVERIAPGPAALPTGSHLAVACDRTGIALGHEVGATVMDPTWDRIDHYQSGRWLLDDRVVEVALDRGRRWFATGQGVTRVDLVPRTLGGKAAAFLDRHERHFWRLGGFSSAWARTPDPYTFDGLALGDDDNDGQWTEEMIGALAFAAGATGDRRYCARARPAVRNMQLLVALPCISFTEAGSSCGFIARSFVRDDEGELFTSKAGQPNWHHVRFEDHEYYWKDDTSSDEYAGHYFGLPLYFDLCADPAERASIAGTLRSATDYLIEGGLRLIDLDGGRTEHGDWSHDYVASCVDGFAECDARDRLDCVSACFGGGFVNGAEILGHLLATWHVTGDDRYWQAYDDLAGAGRYAEAVTFDERVLTATSPTVENHVDHELAMLALHTLIRYEPDATRRARWQAALLGLYETELDEENPLWAALVAGATGAERQREAALESLREYPLDTRFWPISHAHRLDVRVRPERDRFGDLQLAEWPPPYDEQPARWWDQSPYRVSVDGDGRAMRGPMAYSIAYWAARYYGLLGPPEPAPNPLRADGFLSIAHRGGGHLAPEATMQAYQNAIAVGADVLECDVHATSDGVLVCMHDPTVDRTTNGVGAIAAMTFDEARALDAGYRFDEAGGAPWRGRGVVVPTLHEVLTAFPDHPWTIEIKQTSPPIAGAVAAAIVAAGRTRDVVVVSFDQAVLDEVRGLHPDLITGLSAPEMFRFSTIDPRAPGDYRAPGQIVQAPYSPAGDGFMRAERLALARALGLRVHVWTVNDRAELADAIRRGVDGVFTDDPARLWEVMVSEGVRE